MLLEAVSPSSCCWWWLPPDSSEAPLAAAAGAATAPDNMLPSTTSLHLLTPPPCLRLWLVEESGEEALPPAALDSPDNRLSACRASVRLRHRRAKGNQRFLRQVSASPQLQKHPALHTPFPVFFIFLSIYHFKQLA